MDSSEKRNKTQELIDNLQGTCNDLNHGIQEVFGEEFNSFNIDNEVIEQLELDIFLCDCCGWWCEISEESDVDDCERICEDCKEDYL